MTPASVHFIVGPWAAGKSTLAELLPAHLPQHVIFDWDLIIPPLSLTAHTDVHSDPATWPGLHATWAAVIKALVAGGHAVVLLGPATPEQYSMEELGTQAIRCAYLNWPDETIAHRLRARGKSEAEIREELDFAAELRRSSYHCIDAANRAPGQLAELVADWIKLT